VTAAQLIARVKKSGPPPAVLLLGPEAYDRRRLKDALTAAFPEGSVTQHDLSELTLAEVLDDARSLSLFASERLIWIVNAEAVLPKGRAAADDEEGDGPAGDSAPLAAYMKDPTPGAALVFEASRFDFEGDDKRKQDRVRKFYNAIPDVIELRRYASHEARKETEALAARAGFRLEDAALDLLVEALGADIARIAVEVEKLSLFAGNRTVTVDDIGALVPDARATTIFALVNAIARRDRARALEFLDTLTRDGEYLPLALAFLSTQFRMALVAREAGLKSGSQVQSHFTKMGVPMWGSRADQVYQTAAKFSKAQLERAMKSIFEADRGLRDARPDDRIVMEQFILKMSGN
jgi:DNA polymerase III subunit delta